MKGQAIMKPYKKLERTSVRFESVTSRFERSKTVYHCATTGIGTTNMRYNSFNTNTVY